MKREKYSLLKTALLISMFSCANGISLADDIIVGVDDNAVATNGTVTDAQVSGNWTAGNNDTLTMDAGSLTISGYTPETNVNGAITATGGNVNLSDGYLTVSSGSSIADAVSLTVASDSTLDITGTDVSLVLGSDDLITTGANISNAGVITNEIALEVGTLTNTGTLINNADVTATVFNNSGTLTSSATNLKSGVENTGNINLNGGELSTDITGTTGTVNIKDNLNINIANSIANKITVDSDKTLTANANSIGGAVTNNGTVALQGGTLANGSDITGGKITNLFDSLVVNSKVNGELENTKEITGTGSITTTGNSSTSGNITVSTIDNQGVLDNTAELTATTEFKNSGTLNSSATGLKSDVSNTGTVNLSGGDLGVKISGGNITNSDILNTNADNLGSSVSNTGNINLTDGTLASGSAISGSGNTVISGNILLNDKISQAITVNADKTLTTKADNIGGAVTNSGTVALNGGVLANAITGGTITSDSALESNANIEGILTNSGVITGTGTITTKGDSSTSANISNNITIADGKLDITGGTAFGDITNNATLNVQTGGDVAINKVTGGALNVATGTNLGIGASNLASTTTTNNGTITLSDGTLGTSISGSGSTVIAGNILLNDKISQAMTVNADKTLTTKADNIGGAVTNSGTVALNGGVLSNAIAGDGNTVIDGDVSLGAAINQAIGVNSGNTLTTVAGNIGGAVTNNGTVALTGGILNQAVTGSGTTQINGDVTANVSIANAITVETGTLTSDAGNLDGIVTNNSTLSLTGGQLDNAISGTGITEIAGNVTSNASIGNAITIKDTNSLTISADNVDGAVTNEAGTVNLGAGKLEQTISGAGTTHVTGDVVSSSAIANAIIIDGNNSLTIDAGNIDGTVTNTSGTINIGAGKLEQAILGGASGTTHIAGDVESIVSIANSIVIDGTNKLIIGADNVDGTVTNAAGILSLSSGTLEQAVTGAGTTEINGNVNINASIENKLNVASGEVSTNADNLKNTVQNDGKLSLTGGTLVEGSDITGMGSTIITSSSQVTANANITQNEVQNLGQLTNNKVLTTNKMTNDGTILGDGTLVLNGDSTSKGDIVQNSIAIASGSTLTLNNGADIQVDNQTGSIVGNISIEDATSILNIMGASGAGNLENGKLTVGSATLDLQAGNVLSSEIIDLTSNGKLNVNGTNSTVYMNSNDIWAGEVVLTNGSLNYDNLITNGKLNATAGNLNLGSQTGSDATNTVLNIANGSKIDKNVVTDLNNAKINITDGSVALDSVDKLTAGVIALDGVSANLNLDGVSTNANLNLTANSGNLVIENNKVTLANANDSILYAVNTTVNTDLDINNGLVQLNSTDTLTSGKITLNGDNAKLHLDGVTTGSISLNANAGNLILENNKITLANASDSILYAVNTTVNTDVDITNGNVQVDGSDSLISGTILLNGANANLSLDGINTQKVNLDADAGKLVFEKNSVILDNGADDITYLVLAKVDVGAGNNLELKQSTTRLDSSDELVSGAILLNGTNANLLLDGVKTETVNLNAITGNLTVDGTNSKTTTLSNISDVIAKEVVVDIQENATLAVNAGNVVLNDNDKWNGNLLLTSDGNINFDNVSKVTTATSTYNQNGGTLNIKNNSVLEMISGSTISDGSINLDTSKLILNNGVENTSKLVMSNGSLEVIGGSTYNLDDVSNITGGNVLIGGATSGIINLKNGEIKTASTINIAENGILNLSGTNLPDESVVVLNGSGIDADTWAGTINVENGYLGLKDMTVDLTTAAKYTQVAGGTSLENTTMTLANSNVITGGDLQIDNTSVLNITNGALTGINDLYSSGLLNSKTGTYEKHQFAGDIIVNNTSYQSLSGNTVNPDSIAGFGIDLRARSNSDKEYDSFDVAGDIRGADSTLPSTIHIADWNFIGNVNTNAAPTEKEIELQIFTAGGSIDENVNFTATQKEILSPVGYYQLQNRGQGKYALALTRYNPQVYRGQVATVSQWQNQLLVSDLLLNHGSVISKYDDEDKNANKYSDVMLQNAPYQYSKKDGGLWVKSYGNFERLNMSQGLDVGNNAYGTLFGADFGVKELKNGWSLIPTAYLGYNGGHQYFNGVSIYEDGGQFGGMGTFYKDNISSSVLGYIGAYNARYDVAGNKENQLNYFAGLASKTSYDWKLGKNFKLQPNMMLAYNFFGNQNWHSNYGELGMNAGFLNGLNIAPGLNLIWDKETYSIYLTTAYVYNIMGKVDGRAGNIDLPDVKMDHGYIQYGLGATKQFDDTFTGYGQVTVRNGGRTGVGFQAGLKWLVGKDKKSKKDKSETKKSYKKAKV